MNDDCPIEGIVELVAPLTYRGVDGQLRDLIFAVKSQDRAVEVDAAGAAYQSIPMPE